jgi:hypothetical protein
VERNPVSGEPTISQDPGSNEDEFLTLVSNTKSSFEMLSIDPGKVILPPREHLVVLRNQRLMHNAYTYFGEPALVIVTRNVSPSSQKQAKS